MEIKILTDEKSKLVFEIPGVSHGFCNMLKQQLLDDSSVKTATYKVAHPLVNIPTFMVEATNPKAAVQNAVKKLRTFADKTKKELSSSLK